MGYISQDTFLFNATVKENILVGKPSATEEEVMSAAKRANAEKFIKQLPQGYDTVLGDRGLKLSGGERQRIAIARVIIRDPELLIFDEATSALDSESEGLIQESIDNLANKKTIIIITHRLTAVKNVDHIIVLNEGQVTETGMYDELIKARGVYWKLLEESLAR